MNWRRGLFRLWIVGSALFVLAVAFVSYADIKEEFDAVASTPHVLKADERAVALLCADARVLPMQTISPSKIIAGIQ